MFPWFSGLFYLTVRDGFYRAVVTADPRSV
jgi:hypothetical protein